MWRLVSLTVCAWAGLAAAASHELPVDLELILAVDVSDSIDPREARLQRQGYVAALTDAEIVHAITSGPNRRIALLYVEWAQESHQRVLVDWTPISGDAEARAFARALADAPLERNQWTSISGVIDFSVRQFASNGYEGGRRVIDISGDGANNHGRDVIPARDEAVAAGITINGLAITTDRLSKAGWPRSADVDAFYADNVIGGPGAFVMAVDSADAFAGAIRRKLLREIASAPPMPLLAELP